jgi:hypothetical protein
MEQKEMLENEAALEQEFLDLKRRNPRATGLFESRLATAKPAAPPAPLLAAVKDYHYLYALPNTNSEYWHDVYRQRLDRDRDAASKIKQAIEKASSVEVDVVSVNVELFEAKRRQHSGENEETTFVRALNKRFIIRVDAKESSRLPEFIRVDHIDALPAELLAADAGTSTSSKVPAVDANRNPVRLSLCWPFFFALQSSLAIPPLGSHVDLSALGSAFLDIIMVIIIHLYYF